MKIWILIACLSLSLASNAQTPTFSCYISNETIDVTKTIYTFDLYLLNTSTATFEFASGQWGISVNSAVTNGGILTPSVVSGSSQLTNAAQAPTIVTLPTSTFYFNVPVKALPGAGNGSIISTTNGGCSSPGTRVATFKITNTVPFAGNTTMNHSFNFATATGKTPTKITAYVSGVNTDITNQGTYFKSDTAGTCLTNINLDPVAPLYHVSMSLENCIQVDSANIQFDLMVVSDGSSSSAIWANAFQFGVNFNTAILQAGDAITPTYAGNSDLIPPLNSINFPLSGSPDHIRITQSPLTGTNPGTTYMIPSQQYRLGTILLTCGTSFVPCIPINFTLQATTGSGKTICAAVAWQGNNAAVTSISATGTGNNQRSLNVVCSLITSGSCSGLSASVTSTAVSCFGLNNGTAIANASGGTSPFTYIWNNGQTTQVITGLSVGTYSVTVTDAALATVTASTVITQPGLLTASCSGTNNLCNGENNGSASVSASGGTPSYSYSWSNGASTSSISNLVAGNYSVTVTDANNCKTSCSFSVTQPTALTAACSGTAVSCNGGNNGSASVSASGGAPSYSYSWSNGATTSSISNLTSGNYSVTVTDVNSCKTSCSFSVTQPIALSTTCSGTPVSCNGGNNGTASVSSSGGTPSYSYLWSNGSTTSSISNLMAGNYSVTTTDAKGCKASCSFNVTQPTALSVSCSSTNGTCSTGGSASVSASGGSPSYSYSWSNGATTSSISNLIGGNYSVTVTDAGNCKTSCSVSISQSVGPSAICSGTPVSCNSGNNGSALVSASGGTPSYSYLWSSGATTSSVSNLTSGNYSVTVTDANSCKTSCSFSVTQPTALTAACSGTAVSCNGGNNGSASVSASGGTPSYSYSWSNGATASSISNLTSGNYSVTVTDVNSCKTSCSFSVTQPIALSAGCSGTPVSCNGGNNGTASVSVSGGTPFYSYSWSNGSTTSSISNLTAGNYSVTTTDVNGCKASCSFNVTQPTALSVSCNSTNGTCITGGSASVSVSGGSPSYSYSWSNGATTSSISSLIAGSYSVTVTDVNNCKTSCSVSVSQSGGPSAICGGTPVSCNGGNNGTASVTVSGGTPSYTYSWSNGATTSSINNLTSGNYSVTVTDANSCKTSCSFSVTQPTALTAACSGTSVSCNGGNNGATLVSASGGTPSYSYSWSNGSTTSSISNLTSGNYSVTTTDANGCKTSCSFAVTQPAILTAACSGSSVSCNGGNSGSVSVSAFGGTSSYTYSWSNGATTSSINNLTSGNYSVTVTDANSCKTSCSFSVTQPTALTAACSGTSVSCNGGNNGSASVSVSGGTASYSYSWSNGSTTSSISNLTSGNYSVTITDSNGCKVSCSYNVIQPATLITVCSGTAVSCNGGNNGSASVSVLGGTPSYSYSWSNGATSSSISNLTAGNYSVTTTDAKGCKASCSFNVTQPTLLTASCSGTSVSCNSGNNGSVSVSVSGGTPSYSYSWSNAATTSSISNLTSGNYSITITDAKGCKASCSFNITQPTVLSVSCSSTNGTCITGGSASVSASGGSLSYLYLWSNGATTSSINSLIAGNYSVTVTDANNCKTFCSVSVSQTGGPSVICGGTSVSCNGGNNGSASVSASGGTPSYSYSWSNGATASSINNLTSGNYSVTVTDVNSCKATCSFTVTQPSTLVAVCSGTSISCNGGNNGSVSVSASGVTSSYSYFWSNGATSSSVSNLISGNYSVTVTDGKGCTVSCSFTITEPPALNVSCSSTNGTCITGGSASVSASGGTSPYSYLWSNGFTTPSISNLIAGNYSVTVTDANNCKNTCSMSVSQTGGPSVNCNGTPVSCNGGNNGSALASVSGGTPSYSYLWSNGSTITSISNLASGNYSVTVIDANSCKTSCSFSVTEPTALTVACNGTSVSCNGGADGSASVFVSGGTPSYSYSWSNGATNSSISNLTSGNYSVTVTDINSCKATCSFSVTQAVVLNTACSGTSVSCNGGNNGSVSVSVSGGTLSYSYSWSNGSTTSSINNLTTGNFSVTVTDAKGCEAACSFTITEPLALNVSCSSTNGTCITGGSASVSASGGSLSYSYFWSNGATTSSISSLVAGNYSVTVTDANNCKNTCSVSVSQAGGPSVTCSGTSVSCNGGNNGSASVSASGGTPSYFYLWSNGASNSFINNLPSGNYSVTVTDDNNCKATCSFTVTQPATLIAACSGTSVSCNGGNNGSVLVSASGGTPSYSYSWSNGATSSSVSNLPSGNYTVTITDANGCNASSTFNVTQPPALSVLCSSTIGTCIIGGSASVSVSGGNPSYLYFWSNGDTTSSISSLIAGNYSVTVTDANNCKNICSVSVSQPSGPSVICTGTSASCNGSTDGSASVSASGGTPFYSFSWSNGATTYFINNLAAGTFSVTVTDANGCKASCAFNLTQPPALSVSCSSTNGTCTTGGAASVSASGGNPSYSYLWSNGATTSSISGLIAGNYSVTVTDANNCKNTCAVPVSLSAGPSVVCSGTSVSCNGSNNGSASVTASGGNPSYSYLWSNGATNSSISNLISGNYSVTVTNANGCKATCSFAVTQPATLVAACSGTSVSCNGSNNGSASVSASGGTPSYSYLWSNGATNSSISNLTSGNYSVTVTDANSCKTSCSFSVTEPTVLTAACNGSLVSCNGGTDGSASVSVSGGTPFYSYSWSNGAANSSISNLKSGNYFVTVTDANSCEATCSFFVSQPNALSTSLNTTDVTCSNGGSASVSVSGGTPSYNYNWNNGATTFSISGLSAGSYTVTVTDMNACPAIASGVITQPAPPNLSISGLDTLYCYDNVQVVMTGNPPGGVFSGAGVSNQTFNPLLADTGYHVITYTYTDTVTHCSDSVSVIVHVDPCLSLNEQSKNGGFLVFPNPNSGDFYFNFYLREHKIAQIEIIDVLGNTVFIDNVFANSGMNSLHIHLSTHSSSLVTGIYHLRLKYDHEIIDKSFAVF